MLNYSLVLLGHKSLELVVVVSVSSSIKETYIGDFWCFIGLQQ